MDQAGMRTAFESARRPDVALITNHGYAGVEIPVGGAPDTGGQNMYVNALALALDRLGYRVTIFARGGFPFFESDRTRSEPEFLSEHVRYIYVPGGGDDFIRKEDIAVALDEQVDWLDGFIREEARARSVEPWQVYEFVNTHYWDAAVLGVRLVERWRNDVAARVLVRLLDGVVEADALEAMQADRHWRALGEAPVFHLGSMLLECEGSPATPIPQRVQACASHWVAACCKGANCVNVITETVAEALDQVQTSMAPALHPVVAADALGVALLTLSPDVAEGLKADLEQIDRHVWTPHSLGELKDENYRNRPAEVRRDLKFCERRDHERMICDRTAAFAATSTEIAERLRTHYRVPVEHIFYFPPCVDAETFRRYKPEEVEGTYAYLAEVSGLPVEQIKASKLIFETSRMDHTKRKDLLLDAFAQVASDVDDALMFIGGGPNNEVFAQLGRQLADLPALEGRAFLTGFIPEEHIGPLFSMADVYMSASEMEGFGMSVSQAAAAQTAVISSDLIPFSVQYVPEDAVVMPAGDVEDFASALRRLLTDDDERDWRAAGLAEKVRVLDWERQADTFLSYLRRSGMRVAEGSKA